LSLPTGQRTILLVDDEQQQLSVHKMVLEYWGYLVLTATCGRRGIELLSTCTVDEVVVDYEMPGMDGGRVAAEIKRTHPDLPILMLSGQETLPQSALQFVDGFVSKGNAPTFLQLAIRQLLP
jgi:CheY-like chemotaxis protein